MWVGTEKGLDRWDAAQHAFVHYGPVSGSQITVIREDRGGALWVGSFDGGLVRLDRDGHRSASLPPRPPATDFLASDDIRAVLEDQAGHLWVGTPEGLDLLDRATGQFIHYRQDLQRPGVAARLGHHVAV